MKNLTLGLLLLASASVFAAGTEEIATTHAQADSAGLRLGSFRVGQISVFQSGGSSFSGYLNWTPSLPVGDNLRVGLMAGGSYLVARTSSKFVLIDAGGLVEYKLNPSLALDVHGGLQIWLDNGGNRLFAGATGSYLLDEKILGLVDRICLSYTAGLVPTKLAHEIRAGVGIQL